MTTSSIDQLVSCPGCGRRFLGGLALDVHRRRQGAALDCRYRRDEPRGGFRPGLYASHRMGY